MRNKNKLKCFKRNIDNILWIKSEYFHTHNTNFYSHYINKNNRDYLNPELYVTKLFIEII